MKAAANLSPRKRPFNLLLSEVNVQQARSYTDSLSATVDLLLADYVTRQKEAVLAKQQLGDAISEAWNQFNATHGSFADDYSTL